MEDLALRFARLYFGVVGRLAPGLAARQMYHLMTRPRLRSRPSPRAQAVLDAAETFTVPHGEGELVAHRWDPEGETNGRGTVLLVHGWDSRAAHLARWVEPLLERGFAVAALDLPAHGASDGRSTQLPDSVAAIHAVGSRVAPLHGLVGHSFGAVGSAFAVGGGEILGTPELMAERLVLIAGGDKSSDMFRRVAAQLGLGERVVARFFQRIEGLSGRPVESLSVSSAVRRSGVPTLVVHDPEDDEVPLSDAESVAAAPHAELLVTRGLGHRRILRDPGVIESGVAFLAG